MMSVIIGWARASLLKYWGAPVPTPMLFKSQDRNMEMMETCDGVFKLEDRELELNTFHGHVVVTNSVGSVQSTPVQIGKY